MKKILILGFFLTLLITDYDAISKKSKEKDLAYIKVDGFEVAGEWEVHYSKFRSRNWIPGRRDYLPNEKWFKWITSDDKKPNFERRKVLPSEVYKNPFLKDENTILAIQADWDKRGVNWFSLSPTSRRLSKQVIGNLSIEEPRFKLDERLNNFIVLPGIIQKLQCYVWGMGYRYKIEAHIQDHKGLLHIINGGFLEYHGWRNVSFTIPKYISQTSRILPKLRPLRFLHFKITSDHSEENKGFYTYFDYLHASTDVKEDPFYGSGLQRKDIYWEEGYGGEKKPEANK